MVSLRWSVLTPIDDHVKIINKLHHNVVLQVAQLQALDSMTCGEHLICFLYFAMKTFRNENFKRFRLL